MQRIIKYVLQRVSTKLLVEELVKREGVESKTAEPYVDETISANGPAVLIAVCD